METLEFVDEIHKSSLESSSEITGHKTGYTNTFDKFLDGIPKKNRMILVAAEPNVGKSALVVNLAWKIATLNEKAMVLVMTIDDTREYVVPKWISIETGIPINHVMAPNRFILKEQSDYEQKKVMLQNGWSKVKNAINDHKIDIKDASQGSDLNFAENWIRHAQNKYPDREIVFILDNFHKLSGSSSDLRTKFVNATSRVHEMKSRYGITFICTAETRKPFGSRITLNDIAETKKIEYDNDAIILVHNEMHSNPQSPSMFWNDEKEIESNSRKPILELRVAKNKISSFKGTMYMNFQPETCILTESEVDGFQTPNQNTATINPIPQNVAQVQF
jgi:replicative DNA helicase